MLRDGGGFVPSGDSIVQAGDEVLLVLDVGIEERVTERFTDRSGAAADAVADRRVDHLLIGGGLAPPTARALAARGGRHGSCCSWAASPTRPITGRP